MSITKEETCEFQTQATLLLLATTYVPSGIKKTKAIKLL